jgi:hypothetical protein
LLQSLVRTLTIGHRTVADNVDAAETSLPALGALDVAAPVQRDPVQPGGERRVAAKSSQLLERAYEDVLRHLVRQDPIAQFEHGNAEHEVLMAPNQRRARVVIARERTSDQLVIRWGGHASG